MNLYINLDQDQLIQLLKLSLSLIENSSRKGN